MTTPTLAERTVEELLDQRILLLDGELDDTGGTQLCARMVLLAARNPTADIALWINSPGGSVPAMLAIMDTMRMVPNPVTTLALGMAASAGQFLLSAGTPGRRYVLPHSKVLLHQGSAGIGGSAVDIELQAEDLRAIRDTVLGLTAVHTGQTPERIFADSLRDHWYDAEEAREYGFVDHIARSLDEVRPGTVLGRTGFDPSGGAR
ncbi:ClpP family protease [Desertihabitans aurantiacus]|uniref:ClpP family protease n=1 Tax=Desertihabitans aurantiacus TaxID=2282477 RepID=UPI000DF7E481|nr:ATP-dependent Clp protease proteolytic subunit [Desertihabitans aurantiacus]